MAATTETLPAGSDRGQGPGAGRWIDDWRPEDEAFWEGGGKQVARRNLIVSILSEHVGFSIWSMWAVFVLFMPMATYHVDPAGKFLLTSLPTLVGSVLRLPYTFAVAKFGGRNWTIFSAALLLVPAVLAAIVLKPGVSYATLLIVAAVAGVGGGNFASSMTNINAYFPNRLKGRALGLNAGGGNIGVAVVQLVAIVVLATAGAKHPRVILAVYIPLIVLVTLASALLMNNLTSARNDRGAMRAVVTDGHTWIVSLLYIGSFGSFIGFGFAFGQVLQVQYKADFTSTTKLLAFTFLGPLLGSLFRPLGGLLSDRIGGSRVTFANFVLMAAGATVVLVASLNTSLGLFVAGFILLFVFSGIGNGATYKMIPAIFTAKARSLVAAGADAAVSEREARRLSGALIGIAGAIGAFGGVLVNLAFRESFLSYKNGNGAYVGFIAFYALCFLVTWFVYLRPSPRRLDGV